MSAVAVSTTYSLAGTFRRDVWALVHQQLARGRATSFNVVRHIPPRFYCVSHHTDSHCTTHFRTRGTRSTYLPPASGIPAATRLKSTPATSQDMREPDRKRQRACRHKHHPYCRYHLLRMCRARFRCSCSSTAAQWNARRGRGRRRSGAAARTTGCSLGALDLSARPLWYRMRPLLKACVHSTNPQS
jgi:hypothetical protein